MNILIVRSEEAFSDEGRVPMKAKRLEDMEEIDKTGKCDVQLVIFLIHSTRSLRTKGCFALFYSQQLAQC